MQRPLRDNVIIKKIDEDVTESGLIVVEETGKFDPYKGEVLKVGPGRISPEGNRLPMSVKEGDIVIYKQYAGHKIKEDIWLINEKDVIATIE